MIINDISHQSVPLYALIADLQRILFLIGSHWFFLSSSTLSYLVLTLCPLLPFPSVSSFSSLCVPLCCLSSGLFASGSGQVAAVALNGETVASTDTHSPTHTHADTRPVSGPNLMRQIYDGCWLQQIKLTVMYVGGRVSHCTNRPHAHTQMRAPAVAPYSQSFSLGVPVRQPPSSIPA